MLLKLEDGASPKGRQIVDQVQRLIREGHLNPGEALPSTRHLAERLALHRSTVATAYQELWALGWLELRPGAVPRVRRRGALAAPVAEERRTFPWAERLTLPLDPPPRPRPEGGLISFNSLGMDPRLIPVEPLARSLKAALHREGARLLDYGDPRGLPSLRAVLAQRMGRHGVQATPEEILVTQGAQQALDLALRALTRPGDAVLVEAPTYDHMLRLLALHRLRPLAIPEGPEGPDLAALERLAQRERPVLLYTMPSFQNPTGRCLPQSQREGLLALCERLALPILEDGFEEEMKYFGRAMLPLKSMDRAGLVLYAGTFSKVLAPGLRLGWLAGSATCLGALAGLRRSTDLGPSPILQAALEDFLLKGHFDQHLARLHRTFRRRMETALAALRRELDPALATWTAPTGGYLIWLALHGAPPAGLEAALHAHGVDARSGSSYFNDPESGKPFLRLSISGLDEAEITEGIARLGRALGALSHA